MKTADELIAELDELFSAPPRKRDQSKKVPQEPLPEPRFWIPVEVVLTRHSWQCQCGASEEGTPSLFVRERMGRATRLRRCGHDNYPNLPHRLETLEPEIIDTCPYCFQETTGDSSQLRFFFEEELDPFIAALAKTFSEEHEERVEAVEKFGLSLQGNQPEVYPPASEPFAVEFMIGKRHSIHYCSSDGQRQLDEETTAQAVDLANRKLIDIL